MQKNIERKIKKLIFVGFTFFCLLFPKYAFSDEEIKMPPPYGYVNDFANIIENDEELEAKLRNFEEETTNEVFVLTVNSLQGYSIDEFTIRLREQDGWKIGKKDKDNGVLVVVAPNERRVRIDVGYGLEYILTPSIAGTIIEKKMKPYFKESKYTEGINAGIDEIIAVLQNTSTENYEEETTEKSSFQEILEDYIIPLVCIGSVIPFIILSFIPFLPSLLRKVPGYWLGGILGALIGGFLTWFLWTEAELGFFAIFSIPLSILSGILVDMTAESKQYGSKKSGWSATPLISSLDSGGSGGFGGGSGGFSGGGGGSSGGSGASSGW